MRPKTRKLTMECRGGKGSIHDTEGSFVAEYVALLVLVAVLFIAAARTVAPVFVAYHRAVVAHALSTGF